MSRQGQNAHASELSRSGSRLRYWVAGPPDAPVVALTHGVSLDHRTFDGQVAALTDAGYRVLSWDIRGHGASQPMGTDLELSAVAADLIAILDDVGAEQAVLVGQSFGGMVCQEALATAPDRVTGLVMIGTPALGDRPGPVMRVLQRLRIPLARLMPYGSLRRLFSTMVTKDPEVRRYVDEATGQLPKPAFISVSKAAMEGFLREEGAPTEAVPLLLVHGEVEEAMVARALRAWASRDPSARLEVIAGAGHLVNQERPEAFNAVLLDFLASRAAVA